MFGHDGWRPLTVAMIVSGAVFLPPGVAEAAPPGGGPCAQRGVHDCTPERRDGGARPFADPVLGGPARSPSTSVAGASAAGAAPAAPASPTAPAAPPARTAPAPATPAPAAPAPPAATAPDGSSGGRSSAGRPSVGGAERPPSGSTAGRGPAEEQGESSRSRERSSPGSPTDPGASAGSAGERSPDSRSSTRAGGSGGTTGGTAVDATACAAKGGSGANRSSGHGRVDTNDPADDPADDTASETGSESGSGAAGLSGVTGIAGAAWGAVARAPRDLLGSVGAASSVAGAVLGAAAPAAGRADLPADVLKLGDWYLTLPTGRPGKPDTVENPDLARFTNEFFKLNPARNGVVFSARGDGVTTKNSHYPRSELREMNGDQKASWSNTSGSHTLEVCEAITKLPPTKPEVVAAQIHDAEDDVLQIRLEGKKLMVQYDDGGSEALLDPAYELGTPYTVRIEAANGKVDVLYNGEHKAELPLSGSGWYWKVGAYVQSNAGKGDGADAVGEVVVYSLDSLHSGGSQK